MDTGLEEEDGMNWEIRIDISHSVSQFSHSVVSDSLQPHESQHGVDPMGDGPLPVHHQLLEFTQTHVH